jgi:hypothetical protein
MNKEKILILRFSNNIQYFELPLLRGAINGLLGDKNNVLFHNHQGESFRYSYPLIQYKRINQNAAMVCIAEGTEAVGLLLMQNNLKCHLGEKEIQLEIDQVKANQFLIQTWQSDFIYNLRRWLPLNQENYHEFQSIEGVADQCQFLEKILTGNILSMGKGLNIHFESEIKIKITQLNAPRLIRYKQVRMMSFDLEFKSNVSIPDYLGIGKGASLGFGVVTGKNTNAKS